MRALAQAFGQAPATGAALALLVANAVACFEGRQQTTDAVSSSETWFHECERDRDCDVGECVCGACTLACSADRACSDVAEASRCMSSSSPVVRYLCLGQEAMPDGVCTPACETRGDCGADMQCVGGSCLPTPLLEASLEFEDRVGPDIDKGTAGGPAPPVVVDEDGCNMGEAGVFVGNILARGDNAESAFEALSGIRTLVGGLAVQGTNLEHIPYARCLEVITQELVIGDAALWAFESDGNPRLVDLRGLARLREVGTALSISDAPALSSLSGLDSLQRVGADFRIAQAPALRDLSALRSLRYVGGILGITDAGRGQLVGPERLQRVQRLNIADTGFAEIVGFNLLEEAETIAISGNQALRRLEAFASLRRVGSLSITQNPQLSTLALLDDVLDSPPPVNLLTINNNPTLPRCTAERFARQLGTPCDCAFNGPDCTHAGR